MGARADPFAAEREVIRGPQLNGSSPIRMGAAAARGRGNLESEQRIFGTGQSVPESERACSGVFYSRFATEVRNTINSEMTH